jgi:3-dehydroquinate synthase
LPVFRIQDTEFEIVSDGGDGRDLPIRSVPRPYSVEFVSTGIPARTIDALVGASEHPVILVDQYVLSNYLRDAPAIARTPTFDIEAVEAAKSVESALSVVEFMDRQQVSRSSLLVVIGGGIVQDIGAFAACIYKRGVPWAYVPTTLLAQADSCVGAKSGLNFLGTKNLVGVFSAPRRVVVHTGFLASLTTEARLSGLGEVFRLHVIGGPDLLSKFEALLPAAVAGEPAALESLTRAALTIKRSVIEEDEFEVDLRRSMNFGHTLGHALEAITDHEIPHGIAVAVGVLVEASLSHQRGMLPSSDLARLYRIGSLLIPERVRRILGSVTFDGILGVLFRDKKAEGGVLKLVVPEQIGQIRFVDLALDAGVQPLLHTALRGVVADLINP